MVRILPKMLTGPSWPARCDCAHGTRHIGGPARVTAGHCIVRPAVAHFGHVPRGGELSASVGDRLESWKQIAAYLNRGVRTVRRWETEEGLPVHRHMHRSLGSVYAYKSEIDAWRQAR